MSTRASRRIIAAGRQVGKSSLQEMMTEQHSRMFAKSIIESEKYRINKSWNDRRGRKMHRIVADRAVRKWLEEEHSQFGITNPDWWKFDNQINITDKLYTILVLVWAGHDS